MSESGESHQDPTVEMSGEHETPLPKKIGNYLIKRRIASGGMGTVYEAMQEQPRRSVAIKVMRAGRYSASALRRFTHEAQLLARLRHPGIAQVFEAGSYRDGDDEIPFFAMEFIPSARLITDYALERGLNTRAILELFIQVCDAVHHGHQRGIVHRDLKPANILVDSSGHPKIIDFGVARATDSDMAAAAEQTQAGQIVGTLQYMSPEQFEMDSADVDTRADIYALGIVLYELLGKRLPYDVRGSKLHEIPTIVRNSAPPKLDRIDASLGGDLATIVECAMAKDRDRRYQSAHGLGKDLQRYLSGAAIAARPSTFGYQLRVLVRRNKIWISAAGVTLAALIGGTVFSTYMYLEANSERARAELHADRSRKAIDFVGEMMSEAGPEGWGHQPTISDLLKNIRERVDVVFADQPLVAAEIHSTLAWASLPQEDLESFENHCRAALDLRRDNLDPGDPLTLVAMRDLARAQEILGHDADLVETREELVAVVGTTLGMDSLEVLMERDNLAYAYELEGRYEDALAIVLDLVESSVKISGEESLQSLDLMAHAAYVYLKLDQVVAGCGMATRAFDLLGSRPDERDHRPSFVRSAFAACRIIMGDIETAAALYDQTFPRDPGIVGVFQGPSELSQEGAGLLVMWETWCPFSHRTVPIVEDLYRRYEEDGLSVTGLTRVNRGSSDERVELFIRDRKISFPILKDSGKSWSYFAADGTPFVILLSDGRVVWKSSVSNSADLSSGLVRALVAAHES